MLATWEGRTRERPAGRAACLCCVAACRGAISALASDVQDVPHRVGVADNNTEVPCLLAPVAAPVVVERAPVRECERDVRAPVGVVGDHCGAAAEVLGDAVEQGGVPGKSRQRHLDEKADLPDTTAEMLCGCHSKAAYGVMEGSA